MSDVTIHPYDLFKILDKLTIAELLSLQQDGDVLLVNGKRYRESTSVPPVTKRFQMEVR